jgi:hypothetical protein
MQADDERSREGFEERVSGSPTLLERVMKK